MRWLTFHQCSSEWAGELIILAIANQLRGAKCLKWLAFCREILRCDHSQITSDPFWKEHDLLMETGAGITFGVHTALE